MKRKIFKIFTICLTLIMTFNNAIVTFASVSVENYAEKGNVAVYFNKNGMVIDGYTDENGNEVMREYINGSLVQKNTILGDGQNIKTEFYGQLKAAGCKNQVVNINDYGIVSETLNASLYANTYSHIGKIKYRTILDTGTKYYSLKLDMLTTGPKQTTYTIRGYVGPILTLVSILVSALRAPKRFVNKYLNNLVFGAETVFTTSMIDNALSTTVACLKYTYNWKLSEVGNTAHNKKVLGYRYYINDTEQHYGEIYYEGYCPNEWGKRDFGIQMHNEMFPYSVFDIVSWSR